MICTLIDKAQKNPQTYLAAFTFGKYSFLIHSDKTISLPKDNKVNAYDYYS